MSEPTPTPSPTYNSFPLAEYVSTCYCTDMGAMTKVGWQRMDVLVAEHGEDDVLHMVCDQVANGMSLSEVGKAEGITYMVLWKWLKGSDERMGAYRDALEARADLEAHETLRIADRAVVEDVGVAKLRVDTRKWLSSKWGKGMYGDKADGGSGGLTVVVQRGGVLQIGEVEDKGYPACVDGAEVIEGEVL